MKDLRIFFRCAKNHNSVVRVKTFIYDEKNKIDKDLEARKRHYLIIVVSGLTWDYTGNKLDTAQISKTPLHHQFPLLFGWNCFFAMYSSDLRN